MRTVTAASVAAGEERVEGLPAAVMEALGEVKRRTKVIGRFPGETSCLTLVWAVLDLYISHATNGIKFTQLERQYLKRLRGCPVARRT